MELTARQDRFDFFIMFSPRHKSENVVPEI
jgi:hypothetical protein